MPIADTLAYQLPTIDLGVGKGLTGQILIASEGAGSYHLRIGI
jgi:hypothetical protein